METITSTDGTTIAFERSGSGPPLVLVHGTTVDHTTWAEVLPLLEQEFTVYAMDRRGRGESGDRAGAYALAREAEDVVAVVGSIDEPVHLLGHSYGGICALEATLLTDRIRRLTLYEPEVIGEATTDDEQALAEIQRAIDAGDREEALVVFYREFARLSEAELERVRALSTWRRRVDAVHTVHREMEAMYAYEFEPERFRGTTTPTLLLVGEESPPLLHRDAETLHDAIPESRIAVLEGQQHVAYRMAPERFAETVIAFLSGDA